MWRNKFKNKTSKLQAIESFDIQTKNVKSTCDFTRIIYVCFTFLPSGSLYVERSWSGRIETCS